MSSANEGEERRSPLIEIEKQWSGSSHKRILMYIHEGSKNSALSCSLRNIEFSWKDPFIENLSFHISIKVFDSQPNPPFDTKLGENLVLQPFNPNSIKGFANIKKHAKRLLPLSSIWLIDSKMVTEASSSRQPTPSWNPNYKFEK